MALWVRVLADNHEALSSDPQDYVLLCPPLLHRCAHTAHIEAHMHVCNFSWKSVQEGTWFRRVKAFPLSPGKLSRSATPDL